MSKHEYELLKKNDGAPLWIVSSQHNLHDQQSAFDELRKRTAVECHGCDGWGFTEEDCSAPEWHYYELECSVCQGETQLCAYCSGHSKSCECNEGETDE